MEDRFKLRIYKKAEKQMVYDVTYLNPLVFDKRINEYADNYVIMQCTGLKDKNEKLIYESDIVKFKEFHHNWLKGKILFYQEDCLFVNEFINLNNEKDWDYVSKYCLEVIGNIWENPKLIERKYYD